MEWVRWVMGQIILMGKVDMRNKIVSLQRLRLGILWKITQMILFNAQWLSLGINIK
jgi:hypothetical protein